jgi:two-component system phosphate regulon sensor histidine kinase PhoR
VLAQGLEGLGYYLISAIVGLVMLGMAANEWLRLGGEKFRRITLAAFVIFGGRLVGLVVLLLGLRRALAYQEWVLETLVLAAVLWAFQLRDLVGRRWSSRFLIATSAAVGSMLLLGLLLGSDTYSSVPFGPWLVTLLLSLFAVGQWFRHRQRFSLWLGSAFMMSTVSAIGGLVGVEPVAMLGHLAMLVLVALETYVAVLAGAKGLRGQFQASSRQAWQHTQEIAFLLAVSRTLSDSLELQVVLERISEAVARAINADWAYVLMPLKEDDEQLVVVARYGWWGRRWTQDSHPTRRIVVKAGQLSLIRHAILRQHSVLANAPEDYEQFECLHDQFARPQSGPALIQPITRQDRTVGILLLGRVDLSPRERGPTYRQFTEADAQLCQDLMAHIATAIHNARQYQAVVERAKRAAELRRLQENETLRLYSFIDSISDGVIVVTETGNVVLANAAAERVLNVPRQHLLGRIIAPLHAALSRDEGGEPGEQVLFEWDDKQLMGRLAPVREADGTRLGTVVAFRDVTAERRAEQARVEYHNAFSSDLEELLSSIRADSHLLVETMSGSATPLQEQLLELVGANIAQMATLVSNLRMVAALEQDAIQIDSQPVDLSSVIACVVEALRSEVEAGDLVLAVNLPAELPPAWGDPRHLRQIVLNLLDHAVRRTPEGGRIDVWATETFVEQQDGYPEDVLVVSIRDPGAFIPPAQQAHLFDLGYPVDGGSAVSSASVRVGLVVSKGLVAALGGQISIASVPDEGNTLSFSIPTAEAG